MSHNFVDSDENEFGVYYLDSGASHWHLTQNVATNSPKALPYIIAGYNINCGASATAATESRVSHDIVVTQSLQT